MIDQKDLKKLPPADRLTRLKELAEEHKRDLQLVEQLLKETTTELRQKASLSNEEASLAKQLAESATLTNRQEATLDARIAAEASATKGNAHSQEKQAISSPESIAGQYHAPTSFESGEIQKDYNPADDYSPFKQVGYENTWQQHDVTKEQDKKKKDEEERKRFLFP